VPDPGNLSVLPQASYNIATVSNFGYLVNSPQWQKYMQLAYTYTTMSYIHS